VTCPGLEELPPPPAGRTGWPWTEEAASLPPERPDGGAWPRLTIVTPSFNQAAFLEATLRSVLLQGYPDLEYFVMDGGSTDGSVEIVKKYSRWLTDWTSGPDGGQSNAINRGLRLGSGLFCTWINSDDMLCQEALATHASRVGFDAGVMYAGDCLYVDAEARPLYVHRGRIHDVRDLLRVRTVWRAIEQRGHIVQPEVIFPRQLALEVGALNTDNHRTMDFELWGKLLLAGARFEYTHILFAMFRLHEQQKTGQAWAQTQSLVETALQLLEQARDLTAQERQHLAADLRAYELDYWRRTGPLARLGLAPSVVLALREKHAALRRRAAQLIRGTS